MFTLHFSPAHHRPHRWLIPIISIFTLLLAGCNSQPSTDVQNQGTATTLSMVTSHKGELTPYAQTPTVQASPTSTPTGAPESTNTSVNNYWRPGLQTSWQWQLTGKLDTSINVAMYDIDLFDYSAAVIAQLHQAGHKVTCYLDAGAWEPYRPDASSFPEQVKGKMVEGWEEERWLDIRSNQVRALMLARLDLCKQKGFDSVEFDLINEFENDNGFSLTAKDQLDYNIFLANAAHQRGLSAALKQDPLQVAELVSYYEWGLSEECYTYNECELWLPFIRAGKPVMAVEYDADIQEFCKKANALNFNAMKMPLALDGSFRTPCR